PPPAAAPAVGARGGQERVCARRPACSARISVSWMASVGGPPLRIGDWSSTPRIMCPSAYPPYPASARTALRPRRRGCLAAPPDDREARSVKDVSGRGEENARTAGLAPDTLIDGVGLPPVVVPRIELLVVDHQLAVQQIQLFDTGMTMRRIVGPRAG